MKKFIVFIPWVTILLIKPFLKDSHPWKHEIITLDWFAAGATRETEDFGIISWTLLLLALEALRLCS